MGYKGWKPSQEIEGVPRTIGYFQEAAARMLQLPPDLMVDVQEHGNDAYGSLSMKYEGKPSGIRLYPHEGVVVFRHYFRRESTVRRSIEQGFVQAGRSAYAKASRRSKAFWVDVRGIFLTVADFTADKVGVGESAFYLDCILDPAIPVLHIEDGVWIVPGAPGDQVPVTIVGHNLMGSTNADFS